MRRGTAGRGGGPDRNVSRRRVLTGGAAALVGLAAGCATSPELLRFSSPRLRPFVDPLPRLPVVRGAAELVAAPATHRFHRDLPPAATFGYAGSTVFGPVIEAQRDVRLRHTLTNRLDGHVLAADIDPTVHGATEFDRWAPRTNLHLHGGVTEPRHDGHPDDTLLVGSTRVYEYRHPQEAATLWYHDHTMGITRLNVYAGLAGMYLLRDEWDTGDPANPLGLPSGDDELPLVISDRGFDTDGSLRFRTVPMVPQGSWEGGMIGDTMTVNGVVWPVAELGRGVSRLRMVNACNLVTLQLRRSDGGTFWVIGNDLGLLDAPAPTPELLLAPGERLDVLIDTSALRPGDTVDFVNVADIPPQARLFALEPVRPVMRVRVGWHRCGTDAIPTRLRGGPGRPSLLPPVDTGPTTANRVMTISQLLAERNPPAFMTLDNLTFHGTGAAQPRPRQGSTEIWTLVNTTPDDHPIHLHLVSLRVLDRTDLDAVAYQLLHPRPPIGEAWRPDPTPFLVPGTTHAAPAWESGPKDTVRCPPASVTRVLVHFPTEAELGFDPDAEFPVSGHTPGQGFVVHCHILDHEDNEMMLPFRLVD